MCKRLKCSGTLCEYIYTYRLAYVLGVVVVVGATTVLKAILRESYCGRLLVSGDLRDSSEIVSVVSWDIDLMGLITLLTISIVLPLRLAPY